MPIHVERPSRTIEEQVSEGIGGFFKGSMKLFLWYIMLPAFITGTLSDPLALTDGGAAVVFLLSIGGVLCWRIRRRRRARQELQEPEQPSPEAAEQRDEVPQASPDDTYLGRVLEDGERTEIGAYLEPGMRNRHVYLIGKTRTGKTTLLKTMIEQDMERGAGVGFIDPHGDAAEELLGLIPAHRISDVIYFDPTNPSSPAFNPLALPYSPPKLAEDIVSVFRLLLGDSWGPRMEHLLRFGVITLLTDPEPHTLRDLRSLYLDEERRSAIVARLENAQLVEFWEVEYPQMPKGAASPILNKLSAFLAPMSHLERVFSRPENDLDFAAALDGEKILIVNLAKGVLGDEPSRLLGGLIVAGIQQAALARATISPEERRDFYLHVDEFHNFTVASFESILSESAKYRLNLTLANQALGQLSSSLERAIFGNCGSLVAFQVSAEDAPKLRKEMHRSRILVRPRAANEFYPLQAFVAEQVDVYTQALNDKYLGMTVEERRAYRGQTAYGRAGSMADAWRQGSATGEIRRERRAEIERTLDLLTGDDPIDVKTLRELFPDWEFREISFPDVDDFINVPPYHAFCRIGSADNVTAIRCPEAPEPDPARRAEVLEHLEKFAPRIEPTPPAPARQAPREPDRFRE